MSGYFNIVLAYDTTLTSPHAVVQLIQIEKNDLHSHTFNGKSNLFHHNRGEDRMEGFDEWRRQSVYSLFLGSQLAAAIFGGSPD